MTASASAEATAVNICTDMKEGIIARISVVTGQVVGSMLQALISGALVVGVAFKLGFHSTATPVEWNAATGVFALFALALTWLGVAFGLLAKTPESANSLSLILVVPFVTSAFVSAGSMPAGARWFAQNQSFTAVIQTLRGLLTGTPIGHSAMLVAAWCAGLTAFGYLLARARYNRNPAR